MGNWGGAGPAWELGGHASHPALAQGAGASQGVQAEWAGGKIMVGWQAQQMTSLMDNQVLDENGRVAGEEGLGLKSHVLKSGAGWWSQSVTDTSCLVLKPHLQPGRGWLRSFPIGASLISMPKGSGP